MVMFNYKSYNKNMVNTVSKNQTNFSRLALIVASILLIAGFGVLLLEKSGVTNIYTKPAATPAPDVARPVNTVDYSPATTSEQAEGERIKNSIIEQSNTTPTTPSAITITLSAAGQDNKGGPIIVRSIINGATSGSCTLSLVKGSATKTYQSSVVSLGTYYGCEGFSVPITDLSAGTWKLTLKANGPGGIEGSAMQDVMVTL